MAIREGSAVNYSGNVVYGTKQPGEQELLSLNRLPVHNSLLDPIYPAERKQNTTLKRLEEAGWKPAYYPRHKIPVEDQERNSGPIPRLSSFIKVTGSIKLKIVQWIRNPKV